MRAPDQLASSIPQWLRAVVVGFLVVLATGAGLLAYRYYTHPKTMTVAAGSYDGEAGRLMSAIAGRLAKTGAPIRLNVVDTGTALEASTAFSAGKVDLAIVRADVGDLSAARTVVLVTYGVVMIIVPTTEAPYAEDRALELPKPTTNKTTATNMNRFAAGT